MTIARSQQVSPADTRYYHCICRCVRRAFLCGDDPVTKINFDHRKEWLVERMHELAAVFAIKICAYAVMSNHYHMVLYLDQEEAEGWSDQEVLSRYRKIFKSGKVLDQASSGEAGEKVSPINILRARLTDLSWFMRCFNECIARRSNQEDKCKGRFWEGRFKCQSLLDEGALLTCMAYVDLNPIRAGIAATPESSKFTSIYERIQSIHEKDDGLLQEESKSPEGSLMNFQDEMGTPKAEALPIDQQDYFALVDWTGRAIREGKKGYIPKALSPTLERLGIQNSGWLKTVKEFRKRFSRVVGQVASLKAMGEKWGQAKINGTKGAEFLYGMG